MPMSGNTADIAAIRNVVKEMSKVPSQVGRRAVPRLNKRIAQMFSNGTDPYGNKWAALKASTIKRKKGDTRILIRKFQLMPGTFFATTGGAGIKMVVGRAGNRAQDGGKHRVPRIIVPQYGLPSTWRDDLVKSAREAARAAGLK